MSDLQSELQQLAPWFHNLHLPDGIQTCPNHVLGDFPSFKWARLAPFFDADLRGKTVLDIGCNAGFYSIELARRGALVTALDVSEHYLRQARWAANIFDLNDRIQFERKQVYALAGTRERWDIVLFLGVLYHLRYPLLGLDIVSRCVRKTLVIQSLSVPGESQARVPEDLELSDRQPLQSPGWPKLAFVEHRVAGDRTNWWVPNASCMEGMLRSTGLRVTSRPLDEFYLCEPEPQHASSMWTWNEAEYWAAVTGGCPEPRLATDGLDGSPDAARKSG